ncbi:hypothetical protein [Rivularia sp. UHCC 0363]|uniref:hypothetical protein n=1 Tax=Rivularia sp. UHCC 0363 TaxID=3110244 RepID=UPI002B1FA3E0|nr:hypothetical protein [Rivularia sp. UHCC 0363]MEA5594738.1 hypothetical protein [Rivularia sp. UHCC 0363]
MLNFLFSVVIQIIAWTFQIVFMLLQNLVPWFFCHAFYFSGGLLFAVLAPMLQLHIDTLVAFGIGVLVAGVIDRFLINLDLLYRQILFGIIGFAAGWFLNMGLFPPLALAGLSVWQSQHSSY